MTWPKRSRWSNQTQCLGDGKFDDLLLDHQHNWSQVSPMPCLHWDCSWYVG